MKEKVDFFKANSGMGSIDYNTSSGQLTILNGKQQILYQRNNPDFDLFKEFGVNEEDVHHIQVLLQPWKYRFFRYNVLTVLLALD